MWLYDDLVDAIELVGEKHVFLVVGDGASPVQAALKCVPLTQHTVRSRG